MQLVRVCKSKFAPLHTLQAMTMMFFTSLARIRILSLSALAKC